MEISKIKLIVWDLDETLWHGTLSEGNIDMPKENIELIKNAVDAGVMCSICSKNDENQVKKQMSEFELDELFVFQSINWSPKGKRVKQIIQEMNLREPNVLFIDDNPSNRGEVQHECPNIMVSDVDIIQKLIEYFDVCEKKDENHKRLNQYKVLEEKVAFKANFGSNEDFLHVSKIHVEIKNDCLNHIERIHDLILRSNQLNFTKERSSLEELTNTLNDSQYECGYVVASDMFGDYGIVGFYALRNKRLKHFVFSCRTLGMGVEQYVYIQLGAPEICIVGDVSSDLTYPNPIWVNQSADEPSMDKKEISTRKVIFKGPCDMSQIFAYVQDSSNIITEFVYVNDKGVSIEQGTSTTHIVESLLLDDKTKKKLCDELPFGDQDMFSTHIFDRDVDYIVLSTFTDPNLGIYRNKENGALVAFGEFCNDLTDENKWPMFINKSIFVANCNFTEQNLKQIKEKYEFCGRITQDKIVSNLDFIYRNISPKTHLILILGSETAYLANDKEAYEDRHDYNNVLNTQIKQWSLGKSRIKLIDVNNYIEGQNSFTNNINHFTRVIYYKMSEDIIGIINQNGAYHLHKKNRAAVLIKDLFERGIAKVKRILQ